MCLNFGNFLYLPVKKKKSKLLLLLLSKRDNEHGVCVNKWGRGMREREAEETRSSDLGEEEVQSWNKL